MNNPKYQIDKEKKQLVAVPEMKKPKEIDYVFGDGLSDRQVDTIAFNRAQQAYEAHIKSLPPPIDYSPEFEAYSETTPGPYEEGRDFFTIPDANGNPVAFVIHNDVVDLDEIRQLQKATGVYQGMASDKKIALSNLLQHFWAYLIDGKGKELNTYEYLDNPETFPFINQLFAEPAPLPDSWNEWVKKESERYFFDEHIPHPSHKQDVLFIYEDAATSVLNKLLPELERLKGENGSLQCAFDNLKELNEAMKEEKDKEMSRLKGLLEREVKDKAYVYLMTRSGPLGDIAKFENDKWQEFCKKHNIAPNPETSVEADKQIPATLTECGTENGSTRIILTLSEKDANTLSKYLYKEVKIVAP